MAGGTLDDELEALASGTLSLDDVMRQSGVKPLGGTPRSVKPAPKPKKAKPAKRGRTTPAPTPVKAPVAPTAPVADPRLAELEAQLVSARQAEAAAVEALSTLRTELAGTRDDLEHAQARVAERDVHTLAQLLEERGLRGDVRGLAVRSLIDAHRWDELATLIDVVDLRRARRVLDHHLVLHCGEADCPLPEHLAAVSTRRDRCELCAGKGQQGVLRAISDVLLLSGVTRLALLGGPTTHLRLLGSGLDGRVDSRRIRTVDEVGDAQLTLTWEGPDADDVVHVDGGLAGMLTALTAWNAR
ncbi:MAG: hypothetical protein GY884_01350 [Proteobacteria bacterium]|nr:hypothetical protein [Pseudomonadota bacterium]